MIESEMDVYFQNVDVSPRNKLVHWRSLHSHSYDAMYKDDFLVLQSSSLS